MPTLFECIKCQSQRLIASSHDCTCSCGEKTWLMAASVRVPCIVPGIQTKVRHVRVNTIAVQQQAAKRSIPRHSPPTSPPRYQPHTPPYSPPPRRHPQTPPYSPPRQTHCLPMDIFTPQQLPRIVEVSEEDAELNKLRSITMSFLTPLPPPSFEHERQRDVNGEPIFIAKWGTSVEANIFLSGARLLSPGDSEFFAYSTNGIQMFHMEVQRLLQDGD